ncbi:hypothetical protein KM043_006872 [Ampulex compressa]|nr:hypothetical protein KM043_006872 [Ampulex compressa]
MGIDRLPFANHENKSKEHAFRRRDLSFQSKLHSAPPSFNACINASVYASIQEARCFALSYVPANRISRNAVVFQQEYIPDLTAGNELGSSFAASGPRGAPPSFPRFTPRSALSGNDSNCLRDSTYIV